MANDDYELLHQGSYSPITKDGIQLVSTPIQTAVKNHLGLQDAAVITSTRSILGADPLTPRRERLPSILKTSTSVSSQLDSLEDESYIPDMMKKHRDDATGEENPKSRVVFSPTKEVVSYRNEYYNDFYHNENHLQENYMTRQKHDVLLEPIDPPKPPKVTFWAYFNDPNVPYVISLYLQILFNICIMAILFYFGFVLYRLVKEDINLKFETYIIDAKHEISRCTKEYLRNRCSTENGHQRVPALESICTQLEKCMNRDPQLIAKSKITAETFADIINGFIKPISWKALIFMNVLLFGSLIVSNVAFGKYRTDINPEKNKNIQLQERINHLEDLLQKYENNQPRTILQSQHTTELIGRNRQYDNPLINRKGF